MYTLDTHATIQELKSSGFNEKQAEALVTEFLTRMRK